MTNAKQTQGTQINGQNQNEKRNVKMTKQVTNFKAGYSKEIKSTVTGQRQRFFVQARMDIVIGEKVQSVSFGHSTLGGRKTYLSVQGQAPVSMSRADFLKKLRDAGITNLDTVSKALGRLQYFNKDEFIVAKCECCEKGYVTAANIDFIQRNHEKLSEKLGREVTEFSRICYACQGHDATPKKKEPVKPTTIPATAAPAKCEHCGKEVKSQKTVEYSLRTYGKVLCFKPCQSKHPKLEKDNKQSAPVTQPAKKEEPASKEVSVQQHDKGEEGVVITPELLREIMELEVDPFSEIAKFQREYRDLYFDEIEGEHTLWNQTHVAHVMAAPMAKEETTPIVEQPVEKKERKCSICNEVGHTKRTCPHKPTEAEIKQNIKDQLVEEGASEASAMAEELGVVEGASAASPVIQEEANGSGAVREEDTKEVPQSEASDESVCKTLQPEGPASVKHREEAQKAAADFMKQLTGESKQDELPPMPQENNLLF